MNRYLRWICARTDMLIVHRGIKSGHWGERESTLENRWRTLSPGVNTGESLESLKGKKTQVSAKKVKYCSVW